MIKAFKKTNWGGKMLIILGIIISIILGVDNNSIILSVIGFGVVCFMWFLASMCDDGAPFEHGEV